MLTTLFRGVIFEDNDRFDEREARLGLNRNAFAPECGSVMVSSFVFRFSGWYCWLPEARPLRRPHHLNDIPRSILENTDP